MFSSLWRAREHVSVSFLTPPHPPTLPAALKPQQDEREGRWLPVKESGPLLLPSDLLERTKEKDFVAFIYRNREAGCR